MILTRWFHTIPFYRSWTRSGLTLNMWKKIKTIFVLITFLSSAYPLLAEEAKITDVIVSARNGELLVVAKLQGCFTPKIESAILAGIPTTFTFTIDLYEERPFWFDRRIQTTRVIKTLKYDLLKKIFYIYAEKAGDPISFNDFDGAKRAMTEYNVSVPLPGALKTNNGNYYVRMKAKLDKVKLPLKLELILFFVSLWDFETAWYRHPVNF